MSSPGRLRRRLVVLLADVGVTIKPEELQAAEGVHRQDNTGGSSRWGGFGTQDGRGVFLWSIYTMTECVRYGVRLDPNESRPSEIEVWPDWPPDQLV